MALDRLPGHQLAEHARIQVAVVGQLEAADLAAHRPVVEPDLRPERAASAEAVLDVQRPPVSLEPILESSLHRGSACPRKAFLFPRFARLAGLA